MIKKACSSNYSSAVKTFHLLRWIITFYGMGLLPFAIIGLV